MTSGRGKVKEPVKKLKLKKETLKDLDVKRTTKKVKGGGAEYPSQYICSFNCGFTLVGNSCDCTVGCTQTCLYTCPCRK